MLPDRCASLEPSSPVLVNVSFAGCKPFPALLCSGRVLALTHWDDEWPATGVASMEALLERWTVNGSIMQQLCAQRSTLSSIISIGVPVELLRVHAPVSPRQVYCTIGNYVCQLIEAAGDSDDGPTGERAESRRREMLAAIEHRRSNGSPYICFKGGGCVAGPYDDVLIESDQITLDWEVEIGVVIGRRAWRVSAEEASGVVAGYCIVNDITLRERIFREDLKVFGTDWVQSKAHPGWLPVGPWLVPTWNVPDPSQLALSLRLNGKTMQEGVASSMIFTIDQQISYLSQHVQLEPGDLLCTGSPAGFGIHHKRFLTAGDVVEADIVGLGMQRLHCKEQGS